MHCDSEKKVLMQEEIRENCIESLTESEIYLDAIRSTYNYMAIYNLTQDTYTVTVSDDVMKWHSSGSGCYSAFVEKLISRFPEKKQAEMLASRCIEGQMKRFQKGEKSFVERLQMYDGDGELHWIDEHVIYIIEPHTGDLLGVSLSAVVDDQVKRTQELTRITAALSREYLNVYIIRPQIDQQVAVSLNGYLMPAMNQRLGVTVSYEVMLKTYTDERVTEECREHLVESLRAENIEKTMADKTEMDFVYKIWGEDGEKHDYQLKVIRTEEEGTYIFGFKNIDVLMTEERRKEKLYAEALSEAKRANHAKSDFLSRMSHDIRTPINGIVGMSHIIETEIDHKEVVQDGIKKIQMLTQQLEQLVNDVLEMSRIESGKLQLENEPFSISDKLKEIAPGIVAMAESRGVILAGSHFDIRHPYVVGSPLHIQRITMNILSNAVKYNRPGGTMECWMQEKEVDEHHSNYIFTIKDTGIGMSKEFMKRIFEPFTREHETDAANQGTGLGMAITKELLDKLGGSMEIQSELGVGTTVTMVLPLETTEKVAYATIDKAKISLRGKRILLVEDNRLNLEIAQYILEEEQALVDVAANGREAVEAFYDSSIGYYDLILMDIMMPVMNGIDASRAIRGLDRADAGKVPILAMTANAFDEDVKKSLQAGMNDHIAKPINIDLMMEKIAKYLESEEEK